MSRESGSGTLSEAGALRLVRSAAVVGIEDSLRESLEEVERRLALAVTQADVLADEASRHLVRAGGKRIRPTLTLLAAHLGDPTQSTVIDAAVAVELTHLATLYHDDVMDSAPVRRGAPAAHRVWGNTVAILTGDLLFAKASLVVADLGPEAVRLQARTFERLCLGQMHETVGPQRDEDAVEHYLGVLADKTGSLIAASAQFGAMFAGCPQEQVDALVAYGEKVGVAFQLADDVIDLLSDGAESGKTPGTDLREGVPTLPVLLARRAAAQGDTEAQRVIDLVDGDLTEDEALNEALAGLRALPATQQARQQALDWAGAAVEALKPLPEGPAREQLQRFAESLVERTS